MQCPAVHAARTERLHGFLVRTKSAVILKEQVGAAEAELMLALHVGQILIALVKVLRTAERNRIAGREPIISRQSEKLRIESRRDILVPIERGPYGISPQRLNEGDTVINELGLLR